MVAAAPVMASRTAGFCGRLEVPMTWLFGIDSMKSLFFLFV